jgi:uncharacterized damage-inducible protein DinB
MEVKMKKKEWFKRKFETNLEPGIFPGILERLMGTPARLEEKIKNIPSEFYTIKPDNQWSIQENAGHLLDVEPLWDGRLDDILAGKSELRPADLTNKKTDLANHHSNSMKNILKAFRELRKSFTDKLRVLKEEDFEKFSLHPRLKTPMRIIDLCYFIAEHDDYHLARITFLYETLKTAE